MIVTVRTNLAREHLFVVYLFLNPFHQVCDVLCVCVLWERGREGWRERGSEGGKNRRKVRVKGKERRKRSDLIPSSACPAKTSSGLVGRPLSPSLDLPHCSPAPP